MSREYENCVPTLIARSAELDTDKLFDGLNPEPILILVGPAQAGLAPVPLMWRHPGLCLDSGRKRGH